MAYPAKNGLLSTEIDLGQQFGGVTIATQKEAGGNFTLNVGGADLSVSPDALAVAKAQSQEGNYDTALDIIYASLPRRAPGS